MIVLESAKNFKFGLIEDNTDWYNLWKDECLKHPRIQLIHVPYWKKLKDYPSDAFDFILVDQQYKTHDAEQIELLSYLRDKFPKAKLGWYSVLSASKKNAQEYDFVQQKDDICMGSVISKIS